MTTSTNSGTLGTAGSLISRAPPTASCWPTPPTREEGCRRREVCSGVVASPMTYAIDGRGAWPATLDGAAPSRPFGALANPHEGHARLPPVRFQAERKAPMPPVPAARDGAPSASADDRRCRSRSPGKELLPDHCRRVSRPVGDQRERHLGPALSYAEQRQEFLRSCSDTLTTGHATFRGILEPVQVEAIHPVRPWRSHDLGQDSQEAPGQVEGTLS